MQVACESALLESNYLKSPKKIAQFLAAKVMGEMQNITSLVLDKKSAAFTCCF
jgi:hypothetical protein